MASSADVARKVTRFKLQLADTSRSHTVLKILQKLKDLDITLDILAETGIGKTVNSLRRHEQAGELAKSLVRGWRRLVPKESQSHTEEGDVSENMTVKDEPEKQNYSNNQSLTTEDLNNNCLTSQNSSDEALFESADSEKHCEEHKSHNNEIKNQVKSQQENTTSQHDVWQKKIQIQEAEMGNSVVSKKRKKDRGKSEDSKTMLGNKDSEDTQKSSPESKETLKCTFSVGLGSEKESDEKSNRSKSSSKAFKESFSFESADKNVKDAASSETSETSEAPNRERKRAGPKKHDALKYTQESRNEAHSKQKNKKTKIKPKDKKSDGDPEPAVSFESVLNYDVNRLKRKERSRVKKPKKRIKTATEEAMNYPGMKPLKSPEMSVDVSSPKLQFSETVMDLMNIPLPAALPDIGFEYFERKAEKETNVCDISEDSAGFTGQRFNKKMQVYSGAKTVFLPTMMSLRQQCIRILQNNIDLLYETGPLVPFEIVKPVLEKCTPEQLLRVEECNPIYIGETDHLWGKHCQRDFKDSKLQEYESWKEMYIRLYEERERKLQRLTKSIVSAQSNKPKCRQVKMAFIHTVAKPPRDVRIQQEIHGTAAQQPHQLRCSAKVQDNRPRPSYSEPSKSSSTTSGAGNTQDPRKKTRVAPMMAKSLKAFKKQLGRR